MNDGWATANPLRLVRQSAMHLQEEIVLSPVEIAALLSELRDPFYTLILLVSVTGLRRGELFGLRWEDVGFEQAEIRVVLSIVDQIEGASEDTGIPTAYTNVSGTGNCSGELAQADKLSGSPELGVREPSSSRKEALLAGCSTQEARPARSRKSWNHKGDRLCRRSRIHW